MKKPAYRIAKPDEVVRMRVQYAEGATLDELSEAFGFPAERIRLIIRGERFIAAGGPIFPKARASDRIPKPEPDESDWDPRARSRELRRRENERKAKLEAELRELHAQPLCPQVDVDREAVRTSVIRARIACAWSALR